MYVNAVTWSSRDAEGERLSSVTPHRARDVPHEGEFLHHILWSAEVGEHGVEWIQLWDNRSAYAPRA